jgi:hypothetical protein
MKKPEIVYDPMAGIREEADGSFTDEHTGITLERCERCGELEFPVDDSYGLCIRCIEAGHIPHT